MSKVEIFEPAMCCSTGVCGPGVDQELLRVATFLNELEGEGRKIIRYNLSSDPMAFVTNKEVNDTIANEGTEALPITVVDGEIRQKGSYPSNANFAEWAGMTREDIIRMVLKSRVASNGGCNCGGESGCC
ncbi:arsenite efflux transporter metallochaperone ArsD [Acetobacterium malicum]|uniref:Arsenite efflux transporter metallochaperone ArsD n=1 Tax=Acetobacterium malicum TaxID=52692 RepID=A0ABR6YUC9_9FIRM|nr:arsenite efflux transporter metallochaperone ArsD [Acetobacterium malicum]MBC3898731.1 arsenite efflux transporter metallochaperone ArsD [Acetobacterium malicum]